MTIHHHHRWIAGLFLLGIVSMMGGCAASPFEAFVVSTESRRLTVLNFDEHKDLLDVEGSPFDVGSGACDVTYDARHRRVYVVNRGEDTLSVFAVKQVTKGLFEREYVLKQMDRIDTGHEPVAAAVDSRHNLVLVLHKNGTLLRLNGRDLTAKDEQGILASLTPLPEAVDLAYDARNDLIYVIDDGMNGLLVLRGASLDPVHYSSTPAGPCTLCYDEVNDRVYVTYRGDDIAQEPPGLAVYNAGPFCNPLRDPIVLGGPFRCPDVAYDGVHNRIFVSGTRLQVFDADSFEPMEEIQTSLPYGLDTGLIDGASPLLLYIGQPDSVRVHEVPSGDNHPYVAQIPLAGQGDRIAAVRPGCPEILSLAPGEGQVGHTVTILGLNFGDTQGRSMVSFGGAPASAEDITRWNDTSIDVKVPALARSGPVRVIVGNRSSAPPDGEDVRPFEVVPGRIIHVSAGDGSPDGDGSEVRPYGTITRALSAARPSDVVYVHAGRYDRDLGERFPLEIGDGVRVEGYGAGYDMPVTSFKILYSAPGDGAVDMGRGSSLAHVGVYVADPDSGDGDRAGGIICRKTGRIEDVVVAGFRTGIDLDGGPQGEIEPFVTEAQISECETGIRIRGSVNGELVDNHLFRNQVGIDMAGNTSRVVSNDLDDNIHMGIKIQGRAAFITSNWVARTRNPDPESDGYGLWGTGLTHTFTHGNMVYGNDRGVVMAAQPGARHYLRGNTVEGNVKDGMDLYGDGSFDVVLNQIHRHPACGIMLRAGNSFLKDNNISYNGDGLVVHSANRLESSLEGNFFYGNTGAGMAVLGDLEDTEPNVVVRIGGPDHEGNTFSANGKAVFVQHARASIFHNTLEGNQTGVVVSQFGHVSMGSADMPGGNTIRNSTHVGLSNQTEHTIGAAGNTWTPSVQGADGQGRYAEGLVAGPVPPQDGNNYSILSPNGKIQF